MKPNEPTENKLTENKLSVTVLTAENETSLLRLLPPVLRARDFRLYLSGGRRLVDLWLYGGRAILGHKSASTVRELKNAAERGLFAPFPHTLEARFIKALARVFEAAEGRPRYIPRLYADGASLETALERAGFPVEQPFPDPAFPRGKKNKNQIIPPVSIWRPFLEKEVLSPVLIPVLPWPLSPRVLVVEESLKEKFPRQDIIPPVLLAPAARAVHDLAAAGQERVKIKYPKIEKVLSLPECKWKKKGVYLTRVDSGWRELWQKFFEKGFLLPPSPREPLILPRELSPGEEASLAAALGET